MKFPYVVVAAALVLGQFGGLVQAQDAISTNGQTVGVISLSEPQLDKGVPLMQALKNRKTTREFSDKKLTLQQLSELLWAANGVNRPGGQRTAPSALGKYSVDLYVVLEQGIFLYAPVDRKLRPVAEGDFRKIAGTQAFAQSAPVNLVFVADLDKYSDNSASDSDKREWASIEAGAQSQNVSLYCASEGLGAVVRASIDKPGFSQVAKLRPGQKILVAQTIGYTR